MTFGEKLLKLRKEGGLSQEGLAEKLSVSRQAVSRWENEGILPDCVNLLEISRLFGVSTDYLLHDDYQSDGDLPAVRTARDQLAGEKERQGVLLLLAGLHAVFLLLAVGAWEAWGNLFIVVLCAAASLGDIIFVEAWLRSGQAPAAEVPSLRRRYYRLGVWFFSWFPVRWLCVGVFDYWPRPVNVININVVTVIIWLAVCGEVWLMTGGKK
ncbi:MAG: helix-turn-helix transcriptional regulator [Angelakisella sp.]|jgi:transcriptional regulator with XRE-family HTH domain|nr:helix-turn-helix transcriptional regulator [Angelakisella sp.]